MRRTSCAFERPQVREKLQRTGALQNAGAHYNYPSGMKKISWLIGFADLGGRLLTVELRELDLGVDGLVGAAGVDLHAGDAEEALRLL